MQVMSASHLIIRLLSRAEKLDVNIGLVSFVETLCGNDVANLLAVEVHQRGPNSSDISFDLSLIAAVTPIPEPAALTLATTALAAGAAVRPRRRRPR